MKDEKDPAETGPKPSIAEVLKLERITPADIVHFTKKEKRMLLSSVYVQMQQLADEERDAYLEKVKEIIDLPLKNRIWQRNNVAILQAIGDYKKLYQSMPDKGDLADMTGLSLSTVYNHYKYYRTSTMQQQLEQFEFMAPLVLDTVFAKSVEGNMHAAKLFFKVMQNPSGNGFGSSRVKIEDMEP